jgi:hypothetical protein
MCKSVALMLQTSNKKRMLADAAFAFCFTICHLSSAFPDF